MRYVSQIGGESITVDRVGWYRLLQMSNKQHLDAYAGIITISRCYAYAASEVHMVIYGDSWHCGRFKSLYNNSANQHCMKIRACRTEDGTTYVDMYYNVNLRNPVAVTCSSVYHLFNKDIVTLCLKPVDETIEGETIITTFDLPANN